MSPIMPGASSGDNLSAGESCKGLRNYLGPERGAPGTAPGGRRTGGAHDRSGSAVPTPDSRLLGAHHDLCQPLNAIKLLVQSFPHVKEANRDRLIESLHLALGTLERQLASLVMLARLEDAGTTAELEPVALSGVLETVRERARCELGDDPVEVRVVASRRVAVSDGYWLRQVVAELVSNAVRFTKSGRILIGVRRRGGNVRIEVWDSGAGIAEDELDRIFEPFARLKVESRENQRGLGLGLAIAVEGARVLGGELVVSSRPGAGSMFALEMPEAAGGCRAQVY